MMTMNRKTNDKVFLAIVTIALSALAFVLTTLCLPAPFYTNDEVLMRSIANGSYTGTNDGHLIYIMYCLGIIFAGLYKLIPAVNWYDLFMLSLHYLCWAMIVGKVGSFIKSRTGKVAMMFLAMCIVVTVDCKFVFFHQYTILAGVAFATGLLSLWGYFRNSQNSDAVVAVVFFTFSLWIRKQVFLMGLPFVLLILFIRFIDMIRAGEKGKMKGALKVIVALVAVSALSFAVEKVAYSSVEWKDFLQYNSARTDLVDFYEIPSYEEASDILENYGITKEEYEPLHSVNFSFSEKYTTELLKELAKRASDNSAVKGNREFIKSVLVQMVIEWKLAVKQSIGLFILLFAVVNVVLGIKLKKYLFSLASVGAIAYQCAFAAYFVYRMRFPERISYTFYFMHLLFQAGMLLYLAADVSIEKILLKRAAFFKRCFIVFAVVFGCAVFLIFGRKTISVAKEENAEWEPYRNEVNVLCDFFETHSDQRFIVSVPVACFLCDEMGITSKPYPANALSLCYWTCGSPLYAKNSAKLSLTEPDKAFAENRVYFVYREGYDTKPLTDYYSSMGLNVQLDTAETVSAETGLLYISYLSEK